MTTEREGRRDPLTTPAPDLTERDAADLAEARFGIRGRLSRLRSERDQNFRIDADRGSFVMKVSNPADGRAVIELQTAAMRHVAEHDPSLPVMEIVPTVDGAAWTEVERDGSDILLARVFTLMPGRIASPQELDDEAIRRFGVTVGKMGRALRGFFHPAADYELLWDLARTPRLRSLLHHIPDTQRRDLTGRVLDRFDERVAPALGGLRAQVVHNDLTIDNVLHDERNRISGILDFGDVTHTALVCDLAIALASLMWGRGDPFTAVERAIDGYLEVATLEDDEAALLGDLIAARVAAWGVIAAWRSALFPNNSDYITAGDDEAWALLARFDGEGADRISRRLRDACGGPVPYRSVETGALLVRRRRVLRRSPLTYERPLHLVRGDGVWLFDADGRRYLDAYNNVPVVGHSHPRVAEAIARQSLTLNTNTRYLHEAAVELAERLVATMPGRLDTVLFVNSGSEANDLAWRLARNATGRDGGIASAWAYHGVTEATTAFSPEEWPEGGRHDRVALVSAPDAYRGPYRDGRWEERCAEHVAQAVAALGARGSQLAAAFADPAFTSDGILVPPPAYLRTLGDRVNGAGGFLVADEVQAGHGRTGTHLWSFADASIEPDLVTLGKPMGNGHPVAAVVTRSEIVEALPREIEPFSTFGGNPVSCVAALAVLDVIEQEDLIARASRVGRYLRASLESLTSSHELVGEVRGRGLLVGVDLVRDPDTREPGGDIARAVTNSMREHGVLIGATGPGGNVLKIRPPLPFGPEHADELVARLDEALAAARTIV